MSVVNCDVPWPDIACDATWADPWSTPHHCVLPEHHDGPHLCFCRAVMETKP